VREEGKLRIEGYEKGREEGESGGDSGEGM